MKTTWQGVGLMALLSLSACENRAPEKEPPAAKPRLQPWLPYVQQGTTDLAQIRVYGPDGGADAQHALLDSSMENIRLLPVQFQAGVMQQDGRLEEYRSQSLIFTADGRFHRLDLTQSSPPRAATLSAETQAGENLCLDSLYRANDYQQPTNSRLLYRVQDCAGGAWRMLALGDNGATAPRTSLPAFQQVIDGVHAEDGALSGWLVVEAGEVRHYDVDFAQSSLVADVTVDVGASGILRSRLGHHLFVVDEKLLVLYDPGQGQVVKRHQSVESLDSRTFDACQGGGMLADGEQLFFIDHTASGDRLWRWHLGDDSSAVALIAPPPEASPPPRISRLWLSDNKVVFNRDRLDEAMYGFEFVFKTGATKGAFGETFDGNGYDCARLAGDRLWAEKRDFFSGEPRLNQFDLGNGGEESRPGERVLGEIHPASHDPARGQAQPQWLLLEVKGEEDVAVVSVEAASGEQVALLGHVQVTNWLVQEPPRLWLRGYERGLLTVYRDSVADVMYYNVRTDDSLRRLRDSADVAEFHLNY